MKKVGKEVLFINTSENNPRNGEGSLITLKDGSILYAFTEYYGDCEKDHGIARISGCYSYDDGESWSEKQVLIEKDDNAQNIMSVSLIRLSNGNLGIIYLRKEINENNGCYCMPYFRESKDEGKTWSDGVFCTNEKAYYCPFNGTAIVLKSGRILYPVSYNLKQLDVFKTGIDQGLDKIGSYILLLYSDDNGKTWGQYDCKFTSPYGFDIGITEPSVYEHENGDLWIWMRTLAGHQYQTLSTDGGKSWSTVCPNFFFTSPDSPMQIKKFNDLTVAVFNPVPFYATNEKKEEWQAPKRTPFLLAVSKNDGVEFSHQNTSKNKDLAKQCEQMLYYIEDDLNESYCYPALLAKDDYLLVAYYHTNGTERCLNCSKIVKIKYSEIK